MLNLMKNLNKLFQSLKDINAKLWVIEDDKRQFIVKKKKILLKILLNFQEMFTF